MVMSKRVVIAGGGTGGHLYPGIALAKALMRYDSEIKISFIGTERGIESKVLPREGLPLKTIASAGLLGKKGIQRWTSWLKLPVGLFQALGYLIFNRPNLMVGVGGYVSGPAVLSAWLLRIPILIHEQNTLPGATNRLLGKISNVVATSFEPSKKYFPERKVTFTGNMIREEFAQATEPESAPTGKFRILILGGSQGAHSINRSVLEALDILQPEKDRLHFVHQTGAKDEGFAKIVYGEKGFSAQAEAFIYDMAEQYKKASLVICRAGATTLAELTAMGRASILVPYPYAAHNHQEHNARVLVEADAATLVLDREITGEALARIIQEMMGQPEKLLRQSQNSFRLGQRDATNRVRNLCLELMKIAA